MSLRPFLGERTVLIRGGRRFVCRAPTVATVFRLVGTFPAVVIATYKGAAHLEKLGQAAEGGTAATVGVVVPLLLQRRETFASILETCVEMWGGAPGELADALKGADGKALAVDLVVACLELVSNLPALIETLNLDKALAAKDQADAGDVVDDGPSEQVVAFAVLARTFSLDPLTIHDWPYEVFVTLAHDVVPYIAATPEGKELPAPKDGEALDLATLASWPGVGVVDARGTDQ